MAGAVAGEADAEPGGIHAVILAAALGRELQGRGDAGRGPGGDQRVVEGVAEAAGFIDGVDLVAGSDLGFNPGEQLVPRELAGGRDGAVVALRGGGDEVEVHVQAQGEDVAGPGRCAGLASDGVCGCSGSVMRDYVGFIRLGV